MARPREPIELIVSKGKKNLTKAEIAERRASEVQPSTDEIEAPAYLTAAQKKHFTKLAKQLEKIKIMGETDVDTLARYVVAETQYQAAVKEQRKLAKDKPKKDDPKKDDPKFPEPADYYKALEFWYVAQDAADKRQERYYKQASALARDLGLTISSRCKLQVPVKAEEEKPVNKFARFGGKAAGAE